jgi:hypothetical protein
MMRIVFALSWCLLASCAPQSDSKRDDAPATKATGAPEEPESTSAATDEASFPTESPTAPVTPREPGTPGGLPDDRTPMSEAPFSPTSAQGAANVVQIYYANIAERHYDAAWRLWTQGGQGSGMTAEAFAASFSRYSSYDANIGAPGIIEGAAGSLFVTVPVQIYARRQTGEEVHQLGEATLRRVNDVPGSTPEQRQWHIFRIDLESR